jgi:hypothetical protein
VSTERFDYSTVAKTSVDKDASSFGNGLHFCRNNQIGLRTPWVSASGFSRWLAQDF